MVDRLGITTIALAAGLIAIAGTPLSAKSAAQNVNADTIELSAQQNNDRNKKPAAKSAPRRPTPRVNVPHRPPPHANVQRHAPARNVQQSVQHPNVQRRVVRPPSNAPKFAVPQNSGPKVINRAARPSGMTTVRTFTPRGARARVVTAGRLRGIPRNSVSQTSIRGRNYSIWRRGHRIRYHGGYRTFLALSALTALAIAGSEYYPYAYIDAPEDYCDGLTPDGCQLVWEDVQTEEGDIIPQCVAYCPWQ